MKMDIKPVRFVHTLLAGITMGWMAVFAVLFGHATVAMAVQDILTVIGTLILSVMYANFKRNKK